jgi:hypothetical protein
LFHNTAGIFQGIHKSLHLQAEACVAVQGQHLKYLL